MFIELTHKATGKPIWIQVAHISVIADFGVGIVGYEEYIKVSETVEQIIAMIKSGSRPADGIAP